MIGSFLIQIKYNYQKELIQNFFRQNGKKNGYCLKYKNGELIAAEKYLNGKKVKEWHDFISFKKENNLSDLR